MPALRKIILLLISCLFGLGACASLPKIEEFLLPTKPPKVVGPKGELSPQRRKAVLEGLNLDPTTQEILVRQAALLEEITGTPLSAGNQVTLLVDGPATYGAMRKAIEGAKDHINLETFIFDADETGKEFADLLIAKQAQGVQVNLLYDSVGCRNTPTSFFQRMRDAGIRALEFNPINPLKMRGTWLVTERDHRKILVVDGKTAFAGGVNISAVYTKSPSSPSKGSLRRESFSPSSAKGLPAKYFTRSKAPWRDTHIQVEGPAVAEFQRLFAENWKKQGGPELPQSEYFPPLKRKGHELVHVLGSAPGDKTPVVYLMYLSAITHSEKSIHLTNAYFVPNEDMIKALQDAARRGVDVKILLPGSSDIGFVFYAGRSFYSELLKYGVKLYERRGSVLHAKSAVIDGVWSTVGSTNLELWSFLRNYEVNPIILGHDFAGEMEELFNRDLADSDPISLEKWKERGISEKMREWFTRLFRPWL